MGITILPTSWGCGEIWSINTCKGLQTMLGPCKCLINVSSYYFRFPKLLSFLPFSLIIQNCLHAWVCLLDKISYTETVSGTSLVVQWLRIRLPMQGTRVWALVREDPTCRRATKPLHHNYSACALEPTSHNYWAHVPELLKPPCLEPVLCNKRSHRNEKPAHCNEE